MSGAENYSTHNEAIEGLNIDIQDVISDEKYKNDFIYRIEK